MIHLDAGRIAAEAGAEILREGPVGHPERAVFDSREVREGDLFVGLPGEHFDGGTFAADALGAGAWGVLVGEAFARQLADQGADGWILASESPLHSLQRLARAWRRKLGCRVVGVTGSTGKTSVKDICNAILPGRVHTSSGNYNTGVGLPVSILSAPEHTDVLVLEMSMRAKGEIASLCEIAEPDVAAITNVGPGHLGMLGTIDAIAEAKAEILAGLGPEDRAVLPEGEEALAPHVRDQLVTLTFGPGGDVFALRAEVRDGATHALVGTPVGEQRFEFPFDEAHNLLNALCAIAIGVALDAPLPVLAANASRIVFSPLRGEQVLLADGVVVINDSYNANPLSMRAALDHLRSLEADGRRVAVLGEMFELGPEEEGFHREIGAHARAIGIDTLVGVGELARGYAPDVWAPTPEVAAEISERSIRPGDTVLVKGSRGVGLERFTDELVARRGRQS